MVSITIYLKIINIRRHIIDMLKHYNVQKEDFPKVSC